MILEILEKHGYSQFEYLLHQEKYQVRIKQQFKKIEKYKFKISAPSWNDNFNLADGSYSIMGIQDYFEFIIKKQGTLTENLPVQIYPN